MKNTGIIYLGMITVKLQKVADHNTGHYPIVGHLNIIGRTEEDLSNKQLITNIR